MWDEQGYARQLAPLLRQAAGYARSILREGTRAQDAVQEAALRGPERRHTFDVSRSFKGWWFAILRNCCMDAIRSATDAMNVSLDDCDELDAGVIDAGDWDGRSQAMSALSIDHHDILRLRYFADLSYRELAEVLKIPQGTVMSRLHLARTALAARIAKEIP